MSSHGERDAVRLQSNMAVDADVLLAGVRQPTVRRSLPR